MILQSWKKREGLHEIPARRYHGRGQKEKTCALTDEEYNAILKMHSNWKRAKLACIESIFRRFSYEPDTATGPLSFQFGARAKLWQEEYEN